MSDRASLFYIARQLETERDVEEAIQFFNLSGFREHAVSPNPSLQVLNHR